MRSDNLCGQGFEGPVRTLGAPVGLFITEPRLPLVPAGGGVAALAGPQVVVASGIVIFPVLEQGEEKVELLPGGAACVDGAVVIPHLERTA